MCHDRARWTRCSVDKNKKSLDFLLHAYQAVRRSSFCVNMYKVVLKKKREGDDILYKDADRIPQTFKKTMQEVMKVERNVKSELVQKNRTSLFPFDIFFFFFGVNMLTTWHSAIFRNL